MELVASASGCSTHWRGAACNLEWLGFEHLAHRTRSKVSVTMKVPGLPRVASGENAMYGAYLHLLSKSGTLSRRHRCAERKAEAQKNCARFALIRTRAFEKCFSSRVGPCSYLWGEGVRMKCTTRRLELRAVRALKAVCHRPVGIAPALRVIEEALLPPCIFLAF